MRSMIDQVVPAAPRYQFHDRWIVQGNVIDVAQTLQMTDGIGQWWPCFRDVSIEASGDAIGLGRRFIARIKGFLPYILRLKLAVCDANFPHRFDVKIYGDLRGIGSGQLSQAGDQVRIDFHMDVLVQRPLLRLLYSIMHPLAYVQHRRVMAMGEQGLRCFQQQRSERRIWSHVS